jgi:hypothetical protein
VLAATRCALFQLGYTRPPDIVGRDITELFNITFSGLIDSSVRRAFHPVPIFEIRNGARFFAVVYQPVSTGTRRPAADAARRRREESTAASTPRSTLELRRPRWPPISTRPNGSSSAMWRSCCWAKPARARNASHAPCTHPAAAPAVPFVAINCASIPESLIESELFGYRSGAFTGASKDGQRGKLLQANSGTLFLDEIGDMPVALQARLLRVLEEREVVPLGSEAPVKLDIRLVSATHCDLPKKSQAASSAKTCITGCKASRSRMPPLRERADRCGLIRQLAAEESDAGCPVELDESLLALLERQRWPGNVRQLRHLLRSMIALRETDRLTLRDLPPEYRHELADEAASVTASVTSTMAAAAAGCQAGAHGDIPAEGKTGAALNPFESAERAVLLQELKRHQWNLSGVARDLNISRNTLYRKLQRLNIEHPDKSLFH